MQKDRNQHLKIRIFQVNNHYHIYVIFLLHPNYHIDKPCWNIHNFRAIIHYRDEHRIACFQYKLNVHKCFHVFT